MSVRTTSQAATSPTAPRPAPAAGPVPAAPAGSGMPADTLGLSAAAAGAAEPVGGGYPKPPVTKMPSPNQNSRGGAKIDTIVLHHTAGGGTAQSVGSYFQNPAVQVSSNYIVDKDGTIVQPVEDGARSWHAGESVFKGRYDVNTYSIGIELVNYGNGTDPYTDAQYKSLAKLVLYLQETYGIPWERITGHKDISLPRGRKTDPSSNFSYSRLKQEVDALRGDKPSPPTPKPTTPKPTTPKHPSGQASYTVRQGDSLSSIAQRELGDPGRWRELYELNRSRIVNPDVIQPGMVLQLPAGKPAPSPKPGPAPAPRPPAGLSAPIPVLPAVPVPQLPAGWKPDLRMVQLLAIQAEIDALLGTA